MPNPLDALKFLQTPPPQPIGTPIPGPQESDSMVTAQQAMDPAWQRYARSGFEGASNAIQGLIGAGDASSKMNQVGQLIGAGIPLAGIGATTRLVPSASYLASEMGGGGDLMAAEKAMKWGGITSPGTDPIEGLSNYSGYSMPTLPARPAQETLGEQDPRFTPVGGEAMYNLGQPAPSPMTFDPTSIHAQAAQTAVQKYLNKP